MDSAAASGIPSATNPAVYPASATPTPPGTGMNPAKELTNVLTRIRSASFA